jgi:hypothetical protein
MSMMAVGELGSGKRDSEMVHLSQCTGVARDVCHSRMILPALDMQIMTVLMPATPRGILKIG